jgi:flagellar hook-length control protein FliK
MKIRTDFPLTQTASQTATQLAGNGNANTMANFASLLQQQSRAPSLAAPAPAVVAAPPKAAPAASEARNGDQSAESTTESNEAPDEAANEGCANKLRPPSKPRVRQADAQAPARTLREEGSATRIETKDAAANDDEASTTQADSTTRNDALTPPWLAGLMPPPAAPAIASSAGARRSTGPAEVAEGSDSLPGDADAAGSATGATRGRGLPAGAKKADAREALDAAAGTDHDSAAAKESTISLPSFAAVLSEQRLGEQRRGEPAAQRDAAMPSIAGADGAAAANASSTTSTTQDAAVTTHANVRAAVGSPEFPQELGVQLSVLARDGIQQAELHLNPTELGPVSVQIVMDGTQARIDFGADMAATRHAIEAGLPELASALRDAGFTLAGGGVSQHAGGRQGSGGDGARRDGGSARSAVSGVDSGDSTPRTVRTRVSAGGLDVYA